MLQTKQDSNNSKRAFNIQVVRQYATDGFVLVTGCDWMLM